MESDKKCVIVGKGVLHYIIARAVPQINTELNLRGGCRREGRYRVVKVDIIKLNFSYPYIEVKRLGDIPGSDVPEGQSIYRMIQIGV